MSEVQGFVSTEQKRATSPAQKRIIDYISTKGIALIKCELLEKEPGEAAANFLVSYKIRNHEIGMVKIPACRDPDERWRLLALHLEVESQRLG
jgi:hypothetical protein